jgi:hypothetical protein
MQKVDVGKFWTRVVGAAVDEPPYCRKEEDACENNAVVVHGCDANWKRVG